MYKRYKILVGIGLAIGATSMLSSMAAFAVGGGGGGQAPPVPTCTQDIWGCGAWEPCTPQGEQTRVCSLVTDCPESVTPVPDMLQSCVPPAPEPTPEPEITKCQEDLWSCSNWLDCDTFGNMRRTCELVEDCPTAESSQPRISQRCDRLQCGNIAVLRERVECRLRLVPAGLARELEIQFLPEACKAFAVGDTRAECISLYKSFDPCWSLPLGDRRNLCAKDVLGLSEDVSTDVASCQELSVSEAVECMSSLRARVHDMILFRIYDLEERAEELLDMGVRVEDVADFVTIIEELKHAFVIAESKEGRRNVILGARSAWRAFVDVARTQL